MKIKSRAVCILDTKEAFDFNWVLKAHLFVFINFYFDLWVTWPDIYNYYHMPSFVGLQIVLLLTGDCELVFKIGDNSIN